MIRGWVAIVLVMLVALVPAPARAAGAATAGVAVPICIARVAPGDAPVRMFAGGPRYDCAPEQYRQGPGDYWALSAPLPADTPSHRIRVRSMSLWQDALTLHVLYADGKVVTFRETSKTLPRRVQLGAMIEFAAPVRGVPIARLLYRVDGAANARGAVIGVHLATPAESGGANTMMACIYAGFIGLAFALFIYNLALWGALRYRFQLAYCAMVAALIVYAISSSGTLAWLWPELAHNDRIRLNYLTLGLAAASALTFARAFFEPRVFAGLTGRLTTIAIVCAASSGVAFGILSAFDVGLADRVCAVLVIAGLSAVVPILWRAWSTGSAYLTLFGIAWAVPVVAAVFRILASLHLVTVSFWLDNSTVLSLGFESLVSSIAIAYRVHMLSRERDEARTNELVARRLADADPLTGLLNRRAFLAAAIGREGEQALHVLDIDHFKAVNDTLGHDGGDEVLRVFARTLRTAAPTGALVVRLGGEEFAILTDADARFDVEALLGRLRATRMPFDLTVTASAGSSSGPLTTDRDWKILYRDADRALFQAKSSGRDRARSAAVRHAA